MKKIAWMVVLCSIGCITLSGLALAENARSLTGEFVWNQGSQGDLEAIFTPTGEDQWDVSFRFTFRGEDHTYTGRAEGSLSAGALKGKVLNENKKRTFTFSGEFKGGAFRGTHAEIGDGREQRTGTLTLSE